MFVCPGRRYHKSWWNGAAELHISSFTLWHNGRRATQLGRFTLWHSGRQNFWKMNVLKDSAKTDRDLTFSKLLNMYALRRFSTFLKDERFMKTEYQTSVNIWKMKAKDIRITTWVSPSKRGKCVSTTTMNAISKKPPLLMAQDTQ